MRVFTSLRASLIGAIAPGLGATAFVTVCLTGAGWYYERFLGKRDADGAGTDTS